MSAFAIIILSVVAALYRSGHEEFGGSINDPDDGKAVAGTIFTAVIVYAVRSLSPHRLPPDQRLHGLCRPIRDIFVLTQRRPSSSSAVSRASYTSGRAAGAPFLCNISRIPEPKINTPPGRFRLFLTVYL